jgi:hypothetical protein
MNPIRSTMSRRVRYPNHYEDLTPREKSECDKIEKKYFVKINNGREKMIRYAALNQRERSHELSKDKANFFVAFLFSFFAAGMASFMSEVKEHENELHFNKSGMDHIIMEIFIVVSVFGFVVSLAYAPMIILTKKAKEEFADFMDNPLLYLNASTVPLLSEGSEIENDERAYRVKESLSALSLTPQNRDAVLKLIEDFNKFESQFTCPLTRSFTKNPAFFISTTGNRNVKSDQMYEFEEIVKLNGVDPLTRALFDMIIQDFSMPGLLEDFETRIRDLNANSFP